VKDKYVIALDIGTTSLKVGLFSISGELRAIETREQEIIIPAPSRAEQDPYATWDLIGNAVRCFMRHVDKSSVAAIALSVQRGTIVPLGRDGDPLTNLILWMDNRGLSEVPWANTRIREAKLGELSRTSISYISGDSKSLWIQHNAPQIWSQTAVSGTPQTLFLKWLGCEDYVCDQSSGNSHFPQDIQDKTWSAELAEALEFPLSRLPRLVTAVEMVGELSSQAAEHLGLDPTVPLVVGGGDGQCAGAGSGVLTPGLCMINIGTATGVQIYLPEPRLERPAGFSCSPHVDPKAWEMEGHTQASGVVFRWFRDQFGQIETDLAGLGYLDAFDLLVEQALQARAGADSLLFMPFFNGCTAPIPDANMRGAILGLKLEHTRNHIIRALLEGISLEIRWMLESFEKSGAPVNEIRLVGGGARNPNLNQMYADILGRPLITTQVKDAAVVGAAMCAAVAVGAYDDLQEAADHFVNVEEVFEPVDQKIAIYDRKYELFRRAYNIFHESQYFEDLNPQIVR
jgi:xylulokinase